MLIPVSLLSSYLYCPRKVFLQKVLAFREPPKPQLLIGSMRHSVFDRFAGVERDTIVRIALGSSLDEIETLIREAYEALVREEIAHNRDGLYEFNLDAEEVYERSLSTFEADARFRAELIVAFMAAHPVEHEALYEQLTPRIVSERRYESAELGVVGIVDRMLVYDHEVVPFEFKTGRAPRAGLWPGHRIQLAAYLVLLRSEHHVMKGTVRYLDTGVDVELRYTPFVRHEVEQLVREVRALLDGDELPRKVDHPGKCRACGLREQCYAEPNVTQAMVAKFGKDAVIR